MKKKQPRQHEYNMNVNSLIQMYKREKGSSERANFEDLYQSAAEFCNPKADNIQQTKSKN